MPNKYRPPKPTSHFTFAFGADKNREINEANNGRNYEIEVRRKIRHRTEENELFLQASVIENNV